MPFLFVSYRRDDAQGYAGRVSDWLVARFGPESVFKDVDSIRAGEDFASVIEATIARCDAVIAVIGPGWLDGERINEPDDWVRLEIAKALERGISVVPVLVQGAAMPPADALPPDLRPLASRQAVALHDATWSVQLERLVEDLGLRPRKRRVSRSALWLATLSTVVAVATGMFIWRDQTTTPESGVAVAGVDYQLELVKICDSRIAADAERAADTKHLRGRLERAKTNLAQRKALLDVQRRIQASSNFDLARLRALDVPPSMTAAQRSAIAAWARNNARTQAYITALSAAETRKDLLLAIDALAKTRPAIASDGVTLTAQLIRLGGGRCPLEPPKPAGTLTLPDLPRRTPTPTSRATAPAPAAASASGGGPAATPVPKHPVVNPPSTTTQSKPPSTRTHSRPPVNPPSESGSGGLSGGGEG